MKPVALRIDDIGASTKVHERYSEKRWLNIGFLRDQRLFGAWGPYREMTAEEWEQVLALLRQHGAKLTVAVTAAWVESSGQLIFEWRNHEFARANSMNPAPISHETHNAWYAKVMQDPERAVLMAESLGKTVGTLRLERNGNATLVSIFLDPQWHRRGFGPSILMAGNEWVRKNWPDISKLEAHIKEGNAPSISAFKRAGYRKAWSAYIADL